MLKFIISLFALIFFLPGCAETPDGTIVMNEETIENFFERGPLKAYNPPSNLNLVMDQPVVEADIPPVPPNNIRIYGTLDSVGPYQTSAKAQVSYPGANQRGSTFKNSVYGMLGRAGEGGNAWFYADINRETGQIMQGRAYMYGFNGGVCDLRQSADGSWGSISQDNFTISIDGYCYFPAESGSTAAYALLVQGKGNPLATPAPQNMYVNYIVDNNGKFNSIPQDPKKYWEIYDYGTGKANIAQ